jgi:putative N6-adenine-specific DNA methylase
VERLKRDYASPFLPENGGVTKRIQFSIVKDTCTVMLDTSGDGLHKRGYRPLLNEAPIKETLAAGIADLARVFPESQVADPFCGSGTLLIEAALRARNIAPGLRRSFAGEQYGFLGGGVFASAKQQAGEKINRNAAFYARGYDIDAGVIDIARQNAKRAGVADAIVFEPGDARNFKPGEGEVILANPPYGERLNQGDVETLYRAFGAAVIREKFKGLYVITNHAEFEKLLGKKATKRRKLYNGMLPCQLYMYY